MKTALQTAGTLAFLALYYTVAIACITLLAIGRACSVAGAAASIVAIPFGMAMGSIPLAVGGLIATLLCILVAWLTLGCLKSTRIEPWREIVTLA